MMFQLRVIAVAELDDSPLERLAPVQQVASLLGFPTALTDHQQLRPAIAEPVHHSRPNVQQHKVILAAFDRSDNDECRWSVCSLGRFCMFQWRRTEPCGQSRGARKNFSRGK